MLAKLQPAETPCLLLLTPAQWQLVNMGVCHWLAKWQGFQIVQIELAGEQSTAVITRLLAEGMQGVEFSVFDSSGSPTLHYLIELDADPCKSKVIRKYAASARLPEIDLQVILATLCRS